MHTDNVCIEALSVNLNRPILESASRNLLKLSQVINDAKQSDQQRLRAEYDRLVEGLAQTGIRCVTRAVTHSRFLHADKMPHRFLIYVAKVHSK